VKKKHKKVLDKNRKLEVCSIYISDGRRARKWIISQNKQNVAIINDQTINSIKIMPISSMWFLLGKFSIFAKILISQTSCAKIVQLFPLSQKNHRKLAIFAQMEINVRLLQK
jgi:hypothetical protein